MEGNIYGAKAIDSSHFDKRAPRTQTTAYPTKRPNTPLNNAAAKPNFMELNKASRMPFLWIIHVSLRLD